MDMPSVFTNQSQAEIDRMRSYIGGDDRREGSDRRADDDGGDDGGRGGRINWKAVAMSIGTLLGLLALYVYQGDRSEWRAGLATHSDQIRVLHDSDTARTVREAERDQRESAFQHEVLEMLQAQQAAGKRSAR